MALPKQTQKDLAVALGNIGLSPSEVEVLCALLQSTKGIRVADLAKKTRLNRTTLYGITKSLIEKGLVSSVEERGVLRYHSIQPELLLNRIEQTRERLEVDAERIKKALPLIYAQRTDAASSYPSVQFFEGREGIKQAYEDSVRNNKSKIMYGFLGAHVGLEFMGYDWINAYIETRKKFGVRAYTVATDTPFLREFKKKDAEQLRVMKILPPGYEFDLELIAYDDKVLIASFRHEHPLAVLIEDAEIAKLMKAIFRYVDSTLSV